MSELWHILLVEDDDYLNQSIVNSLRKDGYIVQGVKSGAEAIRLVWSEEYDVVIGDLRTPGADGFEMLQWLRSFRPKTRMIMVAASASAADRTQALEAGVVSYLSKPLDLHQLKEELRRLLQQTGFSASLDSLDLLDVIQIITMSRKSIAHQVNTGLEAIAHTSVTLADALDDDRPFITLETVQDDGFDEAFEVFKEHVEDEEMVSRGKGNNEYSGSAENNEAAEWWQQPAVMPPVSKSNGDGQTVTDPAPAKPGPDALPVANVDDITPSTVRKTTATQRGDLPSWLLAE